MRQLQVQPVLSVRLRKENMSPAAMFFALLIGHAVCDFGLQNEYVAKFKAPRLRVEYDYGRDVKYEYNPIWFWVMGSHALMHGGAVWLITQRPILGLAEVFLHFLIDFCKTTGIFDECSHQKVAPPRAYHIDQGLHLFCKFAWAVVMWCHR